MVEKPWSVQIELVEGCTRLCTFCGLNGIRGGPGDFKFLSFENAIKIAKGLSEYCPNARVEFAMHGEPLVHKEHTTIFEVFRHWLPKTQMMVTTNGKMLQKHMQQGLEDIFTSGIDFVVMDTYEPERGELLEEALRLTGMEVVDFYRDWVPKKLNVYQNFHRKVQRTLVLMDDLGIRDGEVSSRTIYNHAGNNPTGMILMEPYEKTCTLPFRELSITYDGKIYICCNDWAGQYFCGNAANLSIKDIWEGERFEAARKMLQMKHRGFSPCNLCDRRAGPRTGLLPKYPAPSPEDVITLIETVESGQSKNSRVKPFISERIKNLL